MNPWLAFACGFLVGVIVILAIALMAAADAGDDE